MNSWSDIWKRLEPLNPGHRIQFIRGKLAETIDGIAKDKDYDVIFYASGFLQRIDNPNPQINLIPEDLNGFIHCVQDHEIRQRLLLILHTPGGTLEAAESVLGYLRNKYRWIEAVVPTYALSAGTTIALGCDRIIMGGQSQLGPTDPQIIMGNKSISAHSIFHQFEQARGEIAQNPNLVHFWAPMLAAYAPALVSEAKRALDYSRDTVRGWLERYMFRERDNPAELAKTAAAYFSGDTHKSHGRRIGRETAREKNLEVLDLENERNFQRQVMTLYHLVTHVFQSGPEDKLIVGNNGGIVVVGRDPN